MKVELCCGNPSRRVTHRVTNQAALMINRPTKLRFVLRLSIIPAPTRKQNPKNEPAINTCNSITAALVDTVIASASNSVIGKTSAQTASAAYKPQFNMIKKRPKNICLSSIRTTGCQSPLRLPTGWEKLKVHGQLGRWRNCFLQEANEEKYATSSGLVSG